MKKISILIAAVLLLAAVSIISSCKKENQAPVVVINKPVDNFILSTADTLNIAGTVSDDNSLHEMSVLLIKSTGDTVLEDYPYVHDLKTYSFQYYFIPSVAGTYMLRVIAEDHDSKSTTAMRNITVN